MSRKQSREVAFKLLFSLCFDSAGSCLEDVSEEKVDEKEQEYIDKLCAEVRENLSSIDALIEKHAHGFSLDRIFKIDLTVLRMAIGEILYLKDITPAVVAVNEAVNIAKKYGTDKSGGWVNGILASVLKENPSIKDEPPSMTRGVPRGWGV